VTTVKHSSEMKRAGKFPEFLYHGTDCKNIESICENGLHMGRYETCNPYSVKTALGQSFTEDCIGNVSMATKEKDAIFFIVVNRNTEEEHRLPQCILKIRTSLLPHDKLFFRDLMSTKMGEAKLFSDVSPMAIDSYKMREFEEKKGHLKVKESIHRCKVV